jgi:hypothetical protein
MSWDWSDEVEARRERDEERRANQCRCGGDMPGFCPGPARCPMCAPEPEEEEEE